MIQGQLQGQGRGSLFCGPEPVGFVITITVPHEKVKYRQGEGEAMGMEVCL